jgi:hypothetical protein
VRDLRVGGARLTLRFERSAAGGDLDVRATVHEGEVSVERTENTESQS